MPMVFGLCGYTIYFMCVNIIEFFIERFGHAGIFYSEYGQKWNAVGGNNNIISCNMDRLRFHKGIYSIIKLVTKTK